MIVLYLWIKFFQAIFWCFAALIWACLAFGGLMFVATVALILIPTGSAGRVWRSGIASLAPPRYLRGHA